APSAPRSTAPARSPAGGRVADAFRPKPVANFEAAGLNPGQVESLVLKLILKVGIVSGRQIAEELGLTFGAFPEFLRSLKQQQLVNYTNAAQANDYYYSLTDTGRLRARLYLDECSYVGAAPVPFSEYLKAVHAQTIAGEQPKQNDLQLAFSDLVISPEMLR